jgi:hypothetical protein
MYRHLGYIHLHTEAVIVDDKLGTVAVTSSEQPRDGESIPRPVERVIAPAIGWETGRRSMARKKVSTTVYIEPEQAERLKLLHERTKVPVAVYIREGIELVLAKYDHLLPGQLPLDVKRSQG